MRNPVALTLNVPEGKRLTCIIPLRVAAEREDAISRLALPKLDPTLPDTVGFLVIDDGSPVQYTDRIQAACREHGYGYVRLDTEMREFSVGRCRNMGAVLARSPYILMHDVDLMPHPGLYSSIVNEIAIQGMDINAMSFLMFGYIFLTKKGTEEFLATDPELRRQLFLHYAMVMDAERIEKVSTGTSANLYNRLWYLSRGGNRPEYEGWGFEDLEFNTRMIRHVKQFPVPRDWQVDRKNFTTIVDWSGWKAVYRLFGDMTFNKGMAFFHAWHPVGSGGTYMARKDLNQKLFTKHMSAFVKEGSEPPALPSADAGKTLLTRHNPFTANRLVLPHLGEIVEAEPSVLEDPDRLERFVARHRVDRVMFHNPYLNPETLAAYRTCRERHIPYVIAERGALPGSVFYDPTGFLVDSTTYGAEQWDKAPTDAERSAVIEYVKLHQAGEDALEQQGIRLTGAGLRERLGIPSHRRVLFVALQRPGDTVTRYFCGEIGSYAAYIDLLRDTAASLPKGWVMVVKRHPLEDETPEIKGAITADWANVSDLLDMCDAVTTFNSGTGVLAMLWNKPVYYAGEAFYADPRLNRKTPTPEALVAALKSGFVPDREAIQRFLNHLLHRAYSFGWFTTKPVHLADGSRMTATMGIDFSVLRFPGRADLHLIHRRKSAIGWESVLFDRYRAAEAMLGAAGSGAPAKHGPKAGATNGTPPKPQAPAAPGPDATQSGQVVSFPNSVSPPSGARSALARALSAPQ